MQVQDVMSLSLGEWVAVRQAWERAHSDDKNDVDPPTEDEFDRAVLAARGVP